MSKNRRPFEYEIEQSGCWRLTSHKRNLRDVRRVQRAGRCFYAHRVVYEETYGPIPEGRSVIHTCGNRTCVNPEHLVLGPVFVMFKERDIRIDETTGCHVCVSHCRDRYGYVKIRKNGGSYYLHRLVYQEHHGVIPEGMIVRHTCGNTSCVNIEHLYLASRKKEEEIR